MAEYFVHAIITIEADSFDEFSKAWDNKDFDDIDILSVTEPEEK
jgi:hypothetical protein